MEHPGGTTGRLLALRSTPSPFHSELGDEVIQSKRFQALPQFTKKEISKFVELTSAGKSLREGLVAIRFPAKVHLTEIHPPSAKAVDVCFVFEVLFQCLAWICQPSLKLTDFERLVECVNVCARSRLAKEVGDVFVLMCEAAFARLDKWNESALISLTKHMFWNDCLSVDAGVFLPMVIEKAGSLGSPEVVQNVVSLVVALFDNRKDVVNGCPQAAMMKALKGQLDEYQHNALMLVSYLSQGPSCPEVEEFYRSIPGTILKWIATTLVSNEKMFPGHWSDEKNPPNMTMTQLREAIDSRHVEPIVSFFPGTLEEHILNVKGMLETSSPVVIEHVVKNAAEVLKRIAGYELSVGISAFFVEMLGSLLIKTNGLELLKALMETAVFDGSVSVFGERRLSIWIESVRRSFFAAVATRSPKLIPDVIQVKRNYPLLFAELIARMLNFVESIDLYFFGNDAFLDAILYVITQLSDDTKHCENLGLGKEICLTFLTVLLKDSAIAQVCFVSSNIVDQMTALIIRSDIPVSFTSKLYAAIGRMPDLHPNVIDFACRICRRYTESPSQDVLVNNIIPLTRNIVTAAQSKKKIAKKIVPVYNEFVKSLELRPNRDILNNVLNMLTVVLPVFEDYELTQRVFNTLVETCGDIYGKTPDETLFVKLLQIMGKSGDITRDSIFTVFAPEVSILAVVIFRESPLFQQVVERLLRLAQASDHNVIMFHRGKLDQFFLKALTGTVTWFGKEYSFSVSAVAGNSVVYQLIESIIQVRADSVTLRCILDVINPRTAPPHPLTQNVLNMLDRIIEGQKRVPTHEYSIGHQAYTKSSSGFDIQLFKNGFVFAFWLKVDLLRLKTLNTEIILLGIVDPMGYNLKLSSTTGAINLATGPRTEMTKCSLTQTCESNVWQYYQIVFKYAKNSLLVKAYIDGKLQSENNISAFTLCSNATMTFGYLPYQVLHSFAGSPPIKLGPFCIVELITQEPLEWTFDGNGLPGEYKDGHCAIVSDGSSIPGRNPTIVQVLREELSIDSILPILVNAHLLSEDELMKILQLVALHDSENTQVATQLCAGVLSSESKALFQQLIGNAAVSGGDHKLEDPSCPDISAMMYLLLSRNESWITIRLYNRLRALIQRKQPIQVLQALLRKVLFNLWIWSRSSDFAAIIDDWRELVKMPIPPAGFAGVFDRLLTQEYMIRQDPSRNVGIYKKYEFEIIEAIGKMNLSQRAVGTLFSVLTKISDLPLVAQYLKMLNRIITDQNKSAVLANIPALMSCPLSEEIFLEIVEIIQHFTGTVVFQALSEISQRYFSQHSLHHEMHDLTIRSIECLYHPEKKFPLEQMKQETNGQSSFWYFWPIVLGVYRQDCCKDVSDFLIYEALQKQGDMSRCLTSIYYVLLILEHFNAFNCNHFRKQFISSLTVIVKMLVNGGKEFHFGHTAEKLFVLSVCRLVDTAHPNRSMDRFTPLFCDHPFCFDTFKQMCDTDLSNIFLRQECDEGDEISSLIVDDFRELLEIADHEGMVKTQIKDCIDMKPGSFDKITEGIRGRLSVAIRGLHTKLNEALNKGKVINVEEMFTNSISVCVGELHGMLLQGQSIVNQLTSSDKVAIHATFKSSLLHCEIPVTCCLKGMEDFQEAKWNARLLYCNLDISVSLCVNRGSLYVWYGGQPLMEMRISDIRVVQYHQPQYAIEIYTGTCESMYLKFSECDYPEAEQTLQAIGLPVIEDASLSLKHVVLRWIDEQISNSELIFAANIISGKSFHDTNNSVIYPFFKVQELSLPPPVTKKLLSEINTSEVMTTVKFLNSCDSKVRAAVHRWVDDSFPFDIPEVKYFTQNEHRLSNSKNFKTDAPAAVGIFGDTEVFGILDIRGKFSVITLAKPSVCRCLAQNETGLGDHTIGCCYKEQFVLYDPERLLLGKKFETGYQEQEMCNVINFLAFYDANTIVTVIEQSEIALTSLKSFPEMRHVLRREDDYIISAAISTAHDIIAYVTNQSVLKVLSLSKSIELLCTKIPFERVKRLFVTHNYGCLVIETVDTFCTLSLSGAIIKQAPLSYAFTTHAHDRESDFIIGLTDSGTIEYFDPYTLTPFTFSSKVPKCVAIAQTNILTILHGNGEISVFRPLELH